jgi:hypothetical protein
MALPPPSDHFHGKTVVEHLKEARQKGALAAAEIHGTEMSGSVAAGADAARETATALLLIGLIFSFTKFEHAFVLFFLLMFSAGWLIWKTGRSALLGWGRLERLHRLIEEERWEIQHNRQQEREELTGLYEAKGFEGKLLEQVIDVLMADDNRCLRVMLEEEMGLTLEAFEHPLKQACGAAIGVAVASSIALIGWLTGGYSGLFVGIALILAGATWMASSLERNRVLNALIWVTALIALVAGILYGFFLKFPPNL